MFNIDIFLHLKHYEISKCFARFWILGITNLLSECKIKRSKCLRCYRQLRSEVVLIYSDIDSVRLSTVGEDLLAQKLCLQLENKLHNY